MTPELLTQEKAREGSRRSTQRRRSWLATSESAVSIGGVAGSVGLIQGSIDLGTAINRRLPFGSPVFAGAALFVIVALPMAIAAGAAWRGARTQNHMAMGAGVLLMGWIVVEIAFIRSFSWLQPTFLLAGAAVFFAGCRQWHLTWGAPDVEVASEMPGDDIDGLPHLRGIQERAEEMLHDA